MRTLDLTTAVDPDAARHRAEALAYFEKRRAQIVYADFRARGYPIGSGAVESANKLVVEARLKGSGMHWDRASVSPMVCLRDLLCSDRWTTEWPATWRAHRAAARRRPRPTADAQPAAPPAPAAPPPPAALPIDPLSRPGSRRLHPHPHASSTATHQGSSLVQALLPLTTTPAAPRNNVRRTRVVVRGRRHGVCRRTLRPTMSTADPASTTLIASAAPLRRSPPASPDAALLAARGQGTSGALLAQGWRSRAIYTGGAVYGDSHAVWRTRT